jgi:hypothetical protein
VAAFDRMTAAANKYLDALTKVLTQSPDKSGAGVPQGVPLMGQPSRFDQLPQSGNIEDRRGEFTTTAEQIEQDAAAILERVKALAAEVTAAIAQSFASLSEASTVAMQSVVATFTGGADLLGTIFVGTIDRVSQSAQALAGAFQEISSAVQTAFVVDPVTAFQSAMDGVRSSIDAVVASLYAAIAAAQQLAAATAAAGAGGSGAPFARGGYVHGPGSGTSDSILARLSAGEFVMNAKAVKHFGAQFFSALNALRRPPGFAVGGMAGPLPRFAAGGMVPATTGRNLGTLRLGLPDGSMHMVQTSEETVQALERVIRRQNAHSAGRKPSWY